MPTDVTPIPDSEFWQRREWIVHVVARNIDLDLEPVKADLLEKLEEPSEEYIWERAERIARDAINVTWGLDERHGVEWHECDDGQGE